MMAYRHIEELKRLRAKRWKLSQDKRSYDLAAADSRKSEAFRSRFAESSRRMGPLIDEVQAEMNVLHLWLYVNVPRLVSLAMRLSDYNVSSDGVMRRRGRHARVDPLEFFFGKGIAA